MLEDNIPGVKPGRMTIFIPKEDNSDNEGSGSQGDLEIINDFGAENQLDKK